MSGGQENQIKSQRSAHTAPALCGTRRRKTPTQASVRELFDYQEDGKLIWKVCIMHLASST